MIRLISGLYGLCVVLVGLALVWGWLVPSRGVLAFQRTQQPLISNVYVIDISTRVFVNVTHAETNHRFPAWNPNGEELVVQAYRPAQIPYDTLYTTTYRTGGTFTPLPIDPLAGLMPDWSSDGCCIAFMAYDQNSQAINIHILNRETGRLWNAVPQLGVNHYAPDWSPDGTEIAFGLDRHDDLDRQEIVIAPVGAPSDERPNTQGVVSGTFPAWSADGKQLYAATELRMTREEGLFVIEQNGQNRQMLPDSNGGGFPAVSSDGQWLAYSGYDTADRTREVLYISRTDGTGRRQITRHRENGIRDSAPAWRP